MHEFRTHSEQDFNQLSALAPLHSPILDRRAPQSLKKQHSILSGAREGVSFILRSPSSQYLRIFMDSLTAHAFRPNTTNNIRLGGRDARAYLHPINTWLEQIYAVKRTLRAEEKCTRLISGQTVRLLFFICVLWCCLQSCVTNIGPWLGRGQSCLNSGLR